MAPAGTADRPPHTSNASASGCYSLCFDPLASRREIRGAAVTACIDPSRPPPHISSPPDYSAVHRAPQITKVLSAMALWKAAGP